MNILLLGLVTGVGFGYVLQRAGVSDCACLFNALNLRNTKAIKLMATAVAVGIFILYPFVALGGLSLGAKNLNVLSLVIGGAIFGVGFALSGLCPGTALAALGAGKKDVLYLIAGGLVGSFVYALVYEPLKPILIDPLSFGKVTLPDLLNLPPLLVGYVFALVILAVVLLLDRRDQKADAQDPTAHQI
ncbi:MAG: YeeE/YedE family protein [Firmicutes bacterium]|nr:YeeE/YedE family protein [Bacillota bacterium]